MDCPKDPLAAVTHPDPYPYYGRLVADRPLGWDETLGVWVAASARAATEVLHHPACRVRPPAEPVPRALLGTEAADVFRGLVRMNDGTAHCPMKRAVVHALGTVDEVRLADLGRSWAPRVAEGGHTLQFRLPARVLGTLLGVPAGLLGETERWVGDLARAFAPGSSAEQVHGGVQAARELLRVFRALLEVPSGDGVLPSLAAGAGRFGASGREVVAVNAIGLMTQAHDATAGLIGNAWLALVRRPGWRARLAGRPATLEHFIEEVLRTDPPVQNTRRFLAEDATVGGCRMRAGDTVLVVLAAAQRDPAVYTEPDRFDPSREVQGLFTFGRGSHACPGERMARTLARVAVEHWMTESMDVTEVAYAPSVNTRIPTWRAQRPESTMETGR